MNKNEELYFNLFKETLYSSQKNEEKLLNIYILILKNAKNYEEIDKYLDILTKYTNYKEINMPLMKKAQHFVEKF